MEDKRAGRKKYLNKFKYKESPKSVPTKEQPKKERIQLDSNWDRYEEYATETGIEEVIDYRKDFQHLSQQPAAEGSFFHFKTDKAFLPASNESDSCTDDIFQLDLKLLEMSISSIPLYDRVGIGNSMFSDTEKRIMDETARTKQKLFEAYLAEEQSSSDMAKHCEIMEKIVTDVFEQKREPVPEVDEVACRGNELADKNSDSEANELEDWLDTVLD